VEVEAEEGITRRSRRVIDIFFFLAFPFPGCVAPFPLRVESGLFISGMIYLREGFGLRGTRRLRTVFFLFFGSDVVTIRWACRFLFHDDRWVVS
jgi:hypothetical protein